MGKRKYRGEMYASELEAEMAQILDRNKIPFEPHLMVDVGNGHEKEIDFYLHRQVRPVWSYKPIRAIEVKGWLSPSDYQRMQLLKKAGYDTFIATPAVVNYWNAYGFINDDDDGLGQEI